MQEDLGEGMVSTVRQLGIDTVMTDPNQIGSQALITGDITAGCRCDQGPVGALFLLSQMFVQLIS